MLQSISLLPAVLAIASITQASQPTAIGVDEWRSLLADTSADPVALIQLSTTNSGRATDLIRSGDVEEGRRLSIVSFVLSAHVVEKMRREGQSGYRQLANALRDNQSALVDGGTPLVSLNLSASNLSLALGQTPSATPFRALAPPPAPRPATGAERRVLLAIISRNLIDPTAPIFGRADIVGEKACVTVNSRNRFGGYTGNQVAIFAYSPELREWALGGIANVPHSACLNTSD